jgi:hypothetical protein
MVEWTIASDERPEPCDGPERLLSGKFPALSFHFSCPWSKKSPDNSPLLLELNDFLLSLVPDCPTPRVVFCG